MLLITSMESMNAVAAVAIAYGGQLPYTPPVKRGSLVSAYPTSPGLPGKHRVVSLGI